MDATVRHREELLDAALDMTFPASDPIAVAAVPVRARAAIAHGRPRLARKRTATTEPVAPATGVPQRGR
jgi:hypothetical protein